MDATKIETAQTNIANAVQEMEDAVRDAGPAPATLKASTARARGSEKPARAAKPKTAAKKPAGFDPEALEAKTRSELEKLEGAVQSLGRKSTEQAFELGGVFEKAGAMLEDQTFKSWVKERCGYEDRTARLYRDVHRTLQPWRKRLVDHAVKPTVMFKLATGDEEQIEAIVAEIEGGKPLKVKDVVERLKTGAGDDAGAANPAPGTGPAFPGCLRRRRCGRRKTRRPSAGSSRRSVRTSSTCSPRRRRASGCPRRACLTRSSIRRGTPRRFSKPCSGRRGRIRMSRTSCGRSRSPTV